LCNLVGIHKIFFEAKEILNRPALLHIERSQFFIIRPFLR